jgi:hypothetical protein
MVVSAPCEIIWCANADATVLLLRHESTSGSEPEPAEGDKMLPASEV